jgi:hypothetical protein
MSQISKYDLLFSEYKAMIALYETIENLPQILNKYKNLFNYCLINANMVCIHLINN